MGGDARRVAAVLLAAAALATPARPATAQMTCAPCVIGIVADGPGDGTDDMQRRFAHEIADLLGPRFAVILPAEKRRVADWTVDGTRRAVDALLADPDVDLVLTAGPVSSSQIVGRGVPPKPVVSAFVLDPESQGFPIVRNADGVRVSGVSNLNYVAFSADHSEEIRRFRQVAPFARLAYLVNETLLAATPVMGTNLRRRAAALGIEAEIIGVGSSLEAAIAAIPAGAEAVYVTPLTQLPPGDFDRLIRALIDRRLPTFSCWGRSDVERGLLMSLYRDAEPRRLARRIASHVQRILLGEDAGALPVDFHRAERPALNAATARAVGVHPGWRVMSQAELLQDERRAVPRRLNLASAVRGAVLASHDLAAFDEWVAAGRQTARDAQAALRPQVAASTFAGTPGRDFVAQSLGVRPPWFAGTSLGLSQVLYSEEARANVQVQEHLLRSRGHAREELRLDVAHTAAVGYLNVLRARTIERLHRQNVAATRANHELADSRRLIGVARASEVVRWEIEIAKHLRAVVQARAQREVAEIALNRLLDRPLEESFEAAGVDLTDPALLASPATLDEYAGNAVTFERFRGFMTAEGLAQSPEIRQLDAAVAAQERAVLAARRASWAPTVAAEADVTGLRYGAVDRSGVGVLPLTPPGPFTWTVGLSAALPLFDGGARRAERTRAERGLDELRLARRAAAARVEQRIRSLLHVAGASHLGIDLATEAAQAARRNLELVADAYGEGDAPALLLIDAQNTALMTGQLEAGAVYDYLIDLMGVQRAIGRFGFFMEPPEIAEFNARLRDFSRAAGRRPGGTPSRPEPEGEPCR